jgi:hypothetical protein
LAGDCVARGEGYLSLIAFIKKTDVMPYSVKYFIKTFHDYMHLTSDMG